MKRNLLFAGALLLSIVRVQGQQNLLNIDKPTSREDAIIQNILNNQLGNTTAQKPTGIQQRVIAQSRARISNTFLYIDSFVYKYSGKNGSRYNYNQIGYNVVFKPVYTPMNIDYLLDPNPLNLLADSILMYSQNYIAEIDRAFYRTDKKIDSVHVRYLDGTGLNNLANDIVSYDSSNNIATVCILKDYGVGLDTYSVCKYYYNVSNTHVVADTLITAGAPYGHYSHRYSYSASGRLDTFSFTSDNYGTIDFRSRTLYDYYNDGKLRKTTLQHLESGSWNTRGYDSLGYTSGADYYTYWKHVQLNSRQLTEQYPGTMGGPDSALQYNWDHLGNELITKYKYEYNTFGNPVKITATPVGPVASQSLSYINFYYEDFDDGLSIKPVAENKDFTVYPNPFSNAINIDWKGKQPGNVMVKLINVIGQEVFETPLKLRTGKNLISIRDMDIGNYILLIQDAAGKTWSSKLIKN